MGIDQRQYGLPACLADRRQGQRLQRRDAAHRKFKRNRQAGCCGKANADAGEGAGADADGQAGQRLVINLCRIQHFADQSHHLFGMATADVDGFRRGNCTCCLVDETGGAKAIR